MFQLQRKRDLVYLRVEPQGPPQDDMISLLRDLRSQVSNERQARIDDLLASVVEDVADAVATVGDPTDKYRGPLGEDDRADTNASAEVGSSAAGEQDLIDEDLMRDEVPKTTDMAGRAFETQWLRNLRSGDPPSTYYPGDDEAIDGHLEAHRRRDNVHATVPMVSTAKASFYLDDQVLDTDMLADPFEMPPFGVAEILVQAYMESAQKSYPFLEKKSFISKLRCYYSSLQRGAPYNVTREWQATLNVVFAIGAVYGHLTKAEWRADDRDHLVYHSRAWSLSLRNPWWFSSPEPACMQLTGLLSFYYLSTGHINRSWVLIGNAVRSGIALGLHQRNDDSAMSATRKELNSRIWWAHYSLERLVSTLTGRPSSTMGYLCSVPLPQPLGPEDDDEIINKPQIGDKGKRLLMSEGASSRLQAEAIPAQQDLTYYTSASEIANSGVYLRSMLDLGNIVQTALELYSASAIRDSWDSVQSKIAHTNDVLDAWATALPAGLNFFRRSNGVEHHSSREQKTLDILYQSTKILITRPCLCRIERRGPNQIASSDTFIRRAAVICVEAAKSIAALLPEAMFENLVVLYQAGPWWQMVHIIMQALTVLCLQIALDATYSTGDHQSHVPLLKKLLLWLRIMRSTNGMAGRAYSISSELVRKLTSTGKIDIRDILRDEDTIMASPTERNSATSIPSLTHTPYPNVLNPVDEPLTSKKQFSGSITAPPILQQRGHTSEIPSRSQYLPVPSQSQNTLPSHSGKGLYLPPIHTNIDLGASVEGPLVASSGLDQTIFPGSVFTSFDERNLWAGPGFEGISFLAH
ncbi:hypothetical protein E8E13_005255 [Curvularia kusanoi]|uniref:Xylanolytic transcriptional activator regulatory domain-containing protein n=1 Tax=Curvularia kusanoi TaxID=90978 RepID=A0A9P4TC76_CURKU|nr:hypothetical protein E8E13_005255 [Curvularia kusanoi]